MTTPKKKSGTKSLGKTAAFKKKPAPAGPASRSVKKLKSKWILQR